MSRNIFDKCVDDAIQQSYAISSRVEAGDVIRVEDAWSQTIDFPKPPGATAYLSGPVDSLLGILPFYDFVYVPILSGFLHKRGGVQSESDFRHLYEIDTRYFLDLVDAGRIIPVFDDTMGRHYSDFIVNRLWTPLYTNHRRHLYQGQLYSIGTAFQSISKIQLPWHDEGKDPWWTEMMIYGCALDGRTVARKPTDPTRFLKTKSDFDDFLRRVGSSPLAIDGTKLDLINNSASLYRSPHVPVSKYLELLDSKTTKALRNVFEATTCLEQAGDDAILNVLGEYNAEIKRISRSRKYKLLRTSSDLFTKHIISVSLAVGGAVGGALAGEWSLGLAGLIVGGVADQVVKLIDEAMATPLQSASRGLTEALSRVLGLDSNTVHLVMTHEELRK